MHLLLKHRVGLQEKVLKLSEVWPHILEKSLVETLPDSLLVGALRHVITYQICEFLIVNEANVLRAGRQQGHAKALSVVWNVQFFNAHLVSKLNEELRALIKQRLIQLNGILRFFFGLDDVVVREDTCY